jgi:hypothetical protein
VKRPTPCFSTHPTYSLPLKVSTARSSCLNHHRALTITSCYQKKHYNLLLPPRIQHEQAKPSTSFAFGSCHPTRQCLRAYKSFERELTQHLQSRTSNSPSIAPRSSANCKEGSHLRPRYIAPAKHLFNSHLLRQEHVKHGWSSLYL